MLSSTRIGSVKTSLQENIYSYIKDLPYYTREGRMRYKNMPQGEELDNFHIVFEQDITGGPATLVYCQCLREYDNKGDFGGWRMAVLALLREEEPEPRYVLRSFRIRATDFLTIDERGISPGPLMRRAMSEVGIAFIREELARPAAHYVTTYRAVEIALLRSLERAHDVWKDHAIEERVFAHTDYYEEGRELIDTYPYASTLPLPQEVVAAEGARAALFEHVLEHYEFDLSRSSYGHSF